MRFESSEAAEHALVFEERAVPFDRLHDVGAALVKNFPNVFQDGSGEVRRIRDVSINSRVFSRHTG